MSNFLLFKIGAIFVFVVLYLWYWRTRGKGYDR